MKRRSLIKAIAAGSLTAATPLTCLVGRNALAAGTTRPIRTVFLFHPNGCVPDIFFPKPGGTVLPAMTAPLQKVFNNLLFVDGIGYAGAAFTHEGGCAKCLTGYSGATKDQGSQGLSSIEVLMGNEDWTNRASNGISLKSIQMGVATQWGDSVSKRISFDGTKDLQAEDDPRKLYPLLFGNTGTGTAPGDLRLDMLSAAKADMARLRTQLGTLEKERMDQHTEALSALETRITASGTGGVCTGPNISSVGTERAETALWRTAVLENISSIQQDMAIAALSCGLTRTMAFSYGVSVSPIVVPGTTNNDHQLSHEDAATHTTSKIWWMGEIAKLITKMANTPDGDGSSLLDNTILVTVSDLAHGNRHNHFRIPMFIAGGKNTGLVGGRTVNLAPYGKARVQGDQDATVASICHTDVLNTIAEVAGYKNVVLPGSEGRIHNAWLGDVKP